MEPEIEQQLRSDERKDVFQMVFEKKNALSEEFDSVEASFEEEGDKRWCQLLTIRNQGSKLE
jgi:hypothetical protein